MTKQLKICDCCETETDHLRILEFDVMTDVKMKEFGINIPMPYELEEITYVEDIENKYELCNTCHARIMTAALQKLVMIKKESSNKIHVA